jgi:hypothetical protein
MKRSGLVHALAKVHMTENDSNSRVCRAKGLPSSTFHDLVSRGFCLFSSEHPPLRPAFPSHILLRHSVAVDGDPDEPEECLP